MNNILWLIEGGIKNRELGTFRNPFRSIYNLFSNIKTNIEEFDNWFILLKSKDNISYPIDFNSTNQNISNISNLFNKPNKRLYFIGMSEDNYLNEADILNDLSNRYGPFNKTTLIPNIQKHKVNLDYETTKDRFIQKCSTFNSTLIIKGNVTFINFQFNYPVDIIVEGTSSTPTFCKCLFNQYVKIYEIQNKDASEVDKITTNFYLGNSDRVTINLCMFYNINGYSSNLINDNECEEENLNIVRTPALQAICNAADIYDNVFLNNDIGMLIISTSDTIFDSKNYINTTSINIKNCKIFNSTYEGLIASFPGENKNYINKIINVDCSYTKEGNGFKVRNCNLIKCKALWNKFYGFILLGNKYLYKCHAINNQTGILVASTNSTLFKLPFFKFNNHIDSKREYNSDNHEPIIKITNFYNCSIRGSLGGSGVVFSIYCSYSLFLNCEISGNQGSLESFYDIIKYKRNYYFTGGGIKGFKDNNLFFINSSIVGNLGYGICIIDDLKRILAPSNILDSNDDEVYNSYFIVTSCKEVDGKYVAGSYQYNGNDLYNEVSEGHTIEKNYEPIQIPEPQSKAHCQSYSPIIDGISYIGHIILINTIVSTNRGGQIIKLFDFKNSFPNKYLEINSLIDNYKSDKFFTLPKNVCAWNPYKGIYKIKGENEEIQNIPLYDMVTIYNSIPPTSGSHLLYKNGGIFKGFKNPDEVDNARDDLDLRIRKDVDKDSPIYTYGVEKKKILEGCKLFDSDDKLDSDIVKAINNVLIKNIDNTDNDIDNNFYKFYFNNNITYLPDIFHYKYMGDSLEQTVFAENTRDINFIRIRNNFFEQETDLMKFIDNENSLKEETHKQFLEIRQAKQQNLDNEINVLIQKNLKQLLSYDFDELNRNIELNDYYIGCFEKHNYCNYTYNTVGRTFNKLNNEFTNEINCCNNQDSGDCTFNNVQSGIGIQYPSGLERSLIIDYTDQEISFEQEEMSLVCQRFQDNIGSKSNIGILPDLSNPEISEDNCIIPNFDMYDFNGIYFETRFICGNDCNFNWNDWNKLIESEESSTSLSSTDLDLWFRSGELVKINDNTKSSLRNAGISETNYNEVEKLYPNVCPKSGEFEFDESNEDFYCNRTSHDSKIENWNCNKKKKNELPLVPDGCPSFGGKKCPPANIQFTMVNVGDIPDNAIKNTSFSIKNIVDDIIDPNSGVSIDSVINTIDSSTKIDPSNPMYLKSKCLSQGFISNTKGLSGRIKTNQEDKKPYIPPKKYIPVKTLIIIITVIVLLIIGVLLI